MNSSAISCLDSAVEQIDIAIRLFMSRRPSYVSALTLAGAAEEICGQTLERQGKRTILRNWYMSEQSSRCCNGSRLSWKEHVAEQNHARNAAKHLTTEDKVLLEFGLQDAAAMMLYRACANYQWLGLQKTRPMLRFERWFYKWSR